VLLRDVDGDEIEDVAILAAGEVHLRSGETGTGPICPNSSTEMREFLYTKWRRQFPPSWPLI
jgi:hypothetical protein